MPLAPDDSALTRQLDALLPQTQCTRCGYPDCAAYARAMAQEGVALNRCPPGGAEGIARLASATARPVLPLDAERGHEGPRALAVIDEAWCIGCTLCIKACPVDCIVGLSKRMHTVVDADCTGCELCVPVCPVDCITMVPVTGDATGWQAWGPQQADAARAAYREREARLACRTQEQSQALADKAQAKLADLAAASMLTDPAVLQAKRAVVQAALDRAARHKTPEGS